MRLLADQPVVLVVEDDRSVADLFSAWLTADYAVRTAYSGEEALDGIDDCVDVVLLDRRMPGLSGDDFLDRIRASGYDGKVAMVTAVEPTGDVLALGFDAYVRKPVEKPDLLAVVSRLVRRSVYNQQMQEYFAVVSKLAVVDPGELSRRQLANYDDLVARKITLRRDIDRVWSSFDERDIEAVLRDLDGPSGPETPADDGTR